MRMKSPDGEVSESSPQNENTDNDEEKENSVQKNDQQIDEPKPQPQLITKQYTYTTKKAENKTRKTTLATLKTSNYPNNNTKGGDVTQRTIEVANAAIINNDRITTPVTFHFRPPNNTSNFSVSDAHQSIFEELKLLDPTLKRCNISRNTH